MTPEGVTTIFGTKPGKTLTIMGGVHGNEICGVEIVRKLMRVLKIERGKVHLILGNPRAIKRGTRQTQFNLNRAFRPEPMLSEVEKQSFEIAEYLPFPIRSHGWDRLHPLGTDGFVNQCGGYGICIECGYHRDPQAPVRARRAVKAFLRLMGAISGVKPPQQSNQRVIHAYSIHSTKRNFRPAKEFANFEPLEEGQLIGRDGDAPIYASADNVIIFVHRRTKPGKEAFVLAREIR